MNWPQDEFLKFVVVVLFSGFFLASLSLSVSLSVCASLSSSLGICGIFKILNQMPTFKNGKTA